jgi:hypothetical protein
MVLDHTKPIITLAMVSELNQLASVAKRGSKGLLVLVSTNTNVLIFKPRIVLRLLTLINKKVVKRVISILIMDLASTIRTTTLGMIQRRLLLVNAVSKISREQLVLASINLSELMVKQSIKVEPLILVTLLPASQ